MSSGSELAFDATIFTLTPTEPIQTLSIYSVDTLQTGVYNLQLKYFYVDYEIDTTSVRAFDIELVNPCPTAVLTIDDSMILPGGLSGTG